MKRVALVTGGTRGIGLGVARALAAEEFDLALCGRREEGEVAGVLEELRAKGGDVRYFKADVASRDDRDRLVAGVRAAFDGLHLLVNNAGIAPAARADLLEAGEESFDRLVAVNLKGPYFLTQAVARWMTEQNAEARLPGRDRVRDVRLGGGGVSEPRRVLREQGGARDDRAALRRAPRRRGIPVYEVRPGIVRTDMTAGVAETYDKLIGEGLLPQGRWGEPEDVGRVVAALARGDAAYSTGAVIPVDGGFSIPRL